MARSSTSTSTIDAWGKHAVIRITPLHFELSDDENTMWLSGVRYVAVEESSCARCAFLPEDMPNLCETDLCVRAGRKDRRSVSWMAPEDAMRARMEGS